MLLWTVQTADAAIDHSKAFSGADTVTMALASDPDGNAAGKSESGLACNAGCICHVFHHACLGELSAAVALPRIEGQVYALASSDVVAFLTEPPTRPPLA